MCTVRQTCHQEQFPMRVQRCCSSDGHLSFSTCQSQMLKVLIIPLTANAVLHASSNFFVVKIMATKKHPASTIALKQQTQNHSHMSDFSGLSKTSWRQKKRHSQKNPTMGRTALRCHIWQARNFFKICRSWPHVLLHDTCKTSLMLHWQAGQTRRCRAACRRIACGSHRFVIIWYDDTCIFCRCDAADVCVRAEKVTVHCHQVRKDGFGPLILRPSWCDPWICRLTSRVVVAAVAFFANEYRRHLQNCISLQ